MVIDECERPPVVAYGGRSPAKSPIQRKDLSKEFQNAAGPYIKNTVTMTSPRGSFGGSVTPKNRNEKIGEERWDARHHVSPS